MGLSFKQWVEIQSHQHHEGVLSALSAGAAAFCAELKKDKVDKVEKEIDGIKSETDAVITLHNFYKKVAPRLDKNSKNRYEERIKAQLKQLGYDVSPELLAKNVESLLKPM
jgi:hypothetical protein